MQDVVVAAATRTPIGSFHDALAPLSVVELGPVVTRSLLEKTTVAPEQIDEVTLGQVLTAGCGRNPARQTTLRAGLPITTPALIINLVRGLGLKAVHRAVQTIHCGDARIMIAGGRGSMSNMPYYLNDVRADLRSGHASMKNSVVHDGLWDAFNSCHMGTTAENLVDKFVISHEQQDAFALRSQQKAAATIEAGRFNTKTTSTSVPQGEKSPRVVDRDGQSRLGTQAGKLVQLKPAFRPGNGTVAAGNTSFVNDDATAVVLTSAAKATGLNLPVLAQVVGCAVSGVDPAIMGIGPVEASLQYLKRAD